MWILITAVVSASLLGSMHCVGMCGPLAIWASGAGERTGGRQMALATTLYHLGRLLTYALAGLIAGAAGQLLDVGGQTLGVQLLAARLVGSLMIAVGAWRLMQLLIQRRAAQKNLPLPAPRPTLITRLLLRLRPYVFRLPVAARGLVTGLLTALLPCGWLYLFALVAAGTGSLLMGPLVMAAFWLGTVPALVGLVSGTQALALRFRRVIPAAAALLLIVGGCYTAAGRGFANLRSLSDIQLRGSAILSDSSTGKSPAPRAERELADVAAGLAELTTTPLPCCAVPGQTADQPSPQPAPTVAPATARHLSESPRP